MSKKGYEQDGRSTRIQRQSSSVPIVPQSGGHPKDYLDYIEVPTQPRGGNSSNWGKHSPPSDRGEKEP